MIQILGMSRSHISTLFPSSLTPLIFFCWSPFNYEFLCIKCSPWQFFENCWAIASRILDCLQSNLNLIAFVALFPGPVLLFCFGPLLGFVKFSLLWFWPAFSCGLQLVHILRGLFSSSPFSLYTILLHLSKRKIRNRPLASVWMKKKVDKAFNSPNLHCGVFFTCLFLLFSVFFKSNWILRFWLGPTPQRNPSMWTWGKFRIPNCAAGSFIKWFWTGQGC